MSVLIHRMSEEDYDHYLTHHGILGQKWGSKNGPPYPLDPAKDYSSQEKKLNKATGILLTESQQRLYANTWIRNRSSIKIGDSVDKAFNSIGVNGSPIRKIQDSLKNEKQKLDDIEKQASELIDPLINNRRTLDEYSSIAGIAAGLEYGYMDTSMGDIGRTMWFYACEDGDQGTITSNSVYINEKNLRDKAINITKKYDEAHNEYITKCEKELSDLLGSYADKPVNNYSNNNVKEDISREMIWRDTKDHIATYMLNEGIEYPLNSGSVKKSVDTAKAIVSNIDFKKGGNAWYIVDAIENAGLSDVKYEDMTDSDWKKLNNELLDLSNKNADNIK